MKIFSGTANPKLGKKVSKHFNTSLSKSEVSRFANSEVRVRIEDDVRGEKVIIIQSTSNPTDTNLMELFFFCDAAKRGGAEDIIAVIPYFGYARQNIQHRPGECVSANVVIRFLETVGFHKVITIDLHDEATEGIFSIPFQNISSLPLLARVIKRHLKGKTTQEQVSVVSPDQGGVERARKFADHFYQNDTSSIVVVEKKRDLKTLHKTKAVDIYGEIKDKTAILVDDIATSGGTLINAARLCVKNGAKKIVAAIVHSDFAPDTPEKIKNSPIDIFFTTDTIQLQKDQKFEKLKQVSVAPLIAEN